MSRTALFLFLAVVPLGVFAKPGPEPELLWRYSAGGKIYASQAEGPDGTIYLISESRGVHALSPNNGLLKWIFRPGGKFLSFIVTSPDGTIYVASDKRELYAVNPGGSVRWVYHMRSVPVVSPGVLPDGSLVVVFPDGKLQVISRKGVLLSTITIPSTPVFPLIILGENKFVWYGDDQVLRMMGREGTSLLSVPLDTVNTVLIYRTADQRFYLGSVTGKVTSVSQNGEILEYQAPVKDRIVFLVEHPEGLAVGTADGSFWIIDKQMQFKLVGKGPNPGGYGAVTDKGLCLYPSAGGGLVLADNREVGAMDLETTVTAPLLTSSGVLICGGADWVLYGYRTDRNWDGWSQEGGGTARNGGSAITIHPLDPDEAWGNRGDYRYYRWILDNGGITELWTLINELKKYKNQEELANKLPYYAIILEELCGLGTIYLHRGTPVPAKDSAIIRGEAYELLARTGDFRFRKILLVSLAAETDPLALSRGFFALAEIGVDFDGQSMALIAERTRSCPGLDDRLALSAAEGLRALKFYNGMITDQSAFSLMDYLVRAQGVSPSARKKIFDIFKVMF